LAASLKSVVLGGVLEGMKSPDPKLMSVAVAGVILTSALASIVPATRATKIDPMAALRA